MARQVVKPNSAEKLFESYMDFSGGLSSETSNEKLKDNEYPVLENVDLAGRGSARRRTGRLLLTGKAGTGQGVFFYYRLNQAKPDVILAISGKLYVLKKTKTATWEDYKDYSWNTLKDKTWDDLKLSYELELINIMDGDQVFTFQENLPIDAAQYGDDLFVATGTKLVEVKYNLDTNTWAGKTINPYKPTVMEAIYIGTNALAENPDGYVQDGVATGTDIEVAGIKPALRTGFVNSPIKMTAFVNKPSSFSGTIDYKWEYKKTSATDYTLGRDFTAEPTGKDWNFTTDQANTYDIRVTIRKTGTTIPTPSYVLSSFQISLIENKTTNTPLPTGGIHKCRKVVLHWDRLLFTQDDENPYQMYISDLNNPRYIPVSNTIKFDTGKQEPVTAIVRYQDMLVVFTKTTIQTLTGRSVDDYRRNLIHDGIGCVADRSAKVVGNNIVFLSHEGIMVLKPNYFKLEMMNVTRIDFPIKGEIIADTSACALTYDSQYWLCIPSKKAVYRLYYDNGMWVKDTSSKLNITQFLQYGNDVFNLTTDGNIYKHDQTVYNDVEEKYSMRIETKYIDLSASFNWKKLKRLYVLAKHFRNTNVGLKVKVMADSATVLNYLKGQAVVKDGIVEWESSEEPNMKFNAGTVFGSWILGQSVLGDVAVSVQKQSIRGKCRRVKLIFEHTQDSPCEIFGFGLEFSLRNIK